MFSFFDSSCCDVPKSVLKAGWEPGKITGDGNCFFRTISKVITGCEDDHLLFKLILIGHACLSEQYYRKNIQVCLQCTR